MTSKNSNINKPQSQKKSSPAKQKKTKAITFWERLPRYGYIIIICISALLYFQTLFFGFTNFDDDFLITKNYKSLSNIENLDDIFFKNSFLTEDVFGFYRPMQTATFMLDAIIGGKGAFIYHLSNLLLHFLTCCAIFFLFKILKYNSGLSLFIALFYSIHPLFVHAVVWLPSRGDLLLGLFGVLAFIFIIKFDENKDWKYFVFHVITFLLAALSKEPAILFPVILFVWYFIIKKNKIFSSQGLALIISWLIIDGFWTYMRLTIVHGFPSANLFGFIPFIKNLATLPEIIAKFIIPINITVMPLYNSITTVLGIILLISILAAIVFNKDKRLKYILFGALWLIILILPGMLYSRSYADTDHFYDYLDHRNYLPMLGFIFILIETLSSYLSKYNTKRLYKFGIIIFIIFSIITITNSQQYKDPLTFFNAAIEANPQAGGAFLLRGNVKKDSGDIPGALADYNEAVRLNPKDADAYNNRGSIKGMLKDYRGSLNDLNEAIKLNPKIPDGYYNRAAIKKILGDFAGAIEDFTEVLRQNPNDYLAMNERGIAKSSLNDFVGAVDDFTKAISIKSDYPGSYYNRGNALYSLGDFQTAINDYNFTIELNPNFANAYLNRANAKYKSNDLNGACADWQRAAELGSAAAGQMVRKYCR